MIIKSIFLIELQYFSIKIGIFGSMRIVQNNQKIPNIIISSYCTRK